MIEIGEYPRGLISGYSENILPRRWFTGSKALYYANEKYNWGNLDFWIVERGTLSDDKTAHIRWPGQLDYIDLKKKYDNVPDSVLCNFYFALWNTFFTGSESVWE
jgi:hypothetical protein